MSRQHLTFVVVAVFLHACAFDLMSVLQNSTPRGVWSGSLWHFHKSMCPRHGILRRYGLQVRFGKTVHWILAFSVSQDRHLPAGLDLCPHRCVSTVLWILTLCIFGSLMLGRSVHTVLWILAFRILESSFRFHLGSDLCQQFYGFWHPAT